jgi:hypothetical protein
MDLLVPALIGGVVLVAFDVIRGESAPWWVIVLIFVVVFAAWEGVKYARRRERR